MLLLGAVTFNDGPKSKEILLFCRSRLAFGKGGHRYQPLQEQGVLGGYRNPIIDGAGYRGSKDQDPQGPSQHVATKIQGGRKFKQKNITLPSENIGYER